MSTVIRRATPADALGVATVHVGTWQSAYKGLVPDEFLSALDVDRRVAAYAEFGVLDDDARPMWIAVRDGDVIGFANAGPSNDEDGVGEVYAIYVSSEHWDTGAGRDLMNEALAWLRERFTQATLWVLDENDRALSFYEKGGWYFDGTRKDDDRSTFVLHEVRYRVDL